MSEQKQVQKNEQEQEQGQEQGQEQEKEWLRQYDALAERFSKIYLSAAERSSEAMNTALDKARSELVSIKEISVERSEKLRTYLQRDLEQSLEAARGFGEELGKRLDPERLKVGARASLASVLEKTGKALLEAGHKTKEPLTCKTGEITSAGTLVCQACGEQLHFKKTGHIPPCPKCKGTIFSKSI